jgi:hypothetical protein
MQKRRSGTISFAQRGHSMNPSFPAAGAAARITLAFLAERVQGSAGRRFLRAA